MCETSTRCAQKLCGNLREPNTRRQDLAFKLRDGKNLVDVSEDSEEELSDNEQMQCDEEQCDASGRKLAASSPASSQRDSQMQVGSQRPSLLYRWDDY